MCEELSNPFAHIWYQLMVIYFVHGAWTVGLVIRGLYAISCLNTDGGVSFILLFMLTWCFEKSLPVCVNAAYIYIYIYIYIFKSVDL